jgi:hypothetical protein
MFRVLLAQTALGMLCAYNVSWLCHDCSETAIVALYASNIPSAVCVAPPEDEQQCSKHIEAFNYQ